MTKVAVLGAGSWGTTMAALLAERAPTVLWARSAHIAQEVQSRHTNRTYCGTGPLPEQLCATASIDEALCDSDLVLLAVPAQGVRGVLELATRVPEPSVPVLSLTKGIEHASLMRVSEVVAEQWPARSVAVLTGPNLASEIAEGQPSASVVASRDASLAAELQELLRTAALRVYTNDDVVGCEIAGAAKNVMAIAAGMAVGLGLGDNTRAALITRSLAEMTRLGVRLGADSSTFMGLAGMGDLVATCTSGKSRNFRVGVALGRGEALKAIVAATRMVAEGVESCGPIVALASANGVEVPVAEQVEAVCAGETTPAATIPLLMSRAPRSELDGP